MGRQNPGKWIKNLLLGKKSSSKSNSSKKKDVPKPPSNKDVVAVSSEGSMAIPTVTYSPPTTSSGASATKGVISENEVVSESSSSERVILAIGDEQNNSQEDVANIDPQDHLENIKLTEAAIIAQAAIRGHQARRKFRILRGMVPLQALIRSMLVRKEAVSALYCVKGIVKFQALARGHKVRHSDIGLEVKKIFEDNKCSNSVGLITFRKAEKLSDNAFVLKLLASSPSTVSTHLKYDSREPNLAWEWLNRWTRSHFWAPLPEQKKLNSLSDEKNDSSKTVETDDERKVKRYTKKDSNNKLHSPIKEHSQKENARSNSKKTSANEKRKHSTRKSSDHSITDVTQNNDKDFQRRASLPANFTNHNNNELLQETTPRSRVPSYMAPTESAKAKLRGQGSPRFANDLADKSSINKRLSLSSSLNGKFGLFSPRSERLEAISNKGLIKTDRSLSSSRDFTDRLMQPQWKR